jgi:hypothetical protein
VNDRRKLVHRFTMLIFGGRLPRRLQTFAQRSLAVVREKALRMDRAAEARDTHAGRHVTSCGLDLRHRTRNRHPKFFAGLKSARDDEICAKLSNRRGSVRDSSAEIVAGEDQLYLQLHSRAAARSGTSDPARFKEGTDDENSPAFMAIRVATLCIRSACSAMPVGSLSRWACSSPDFLNARGESV